jgi:hypothetical protein
MFETEEDKFLYLVGCALNGTAAAQADIPKITRQAYGIAEEMLVLIHKLKQTNDYEPSANGSAGSHVGGKGAKEDKADNNVRVADLGKTEKPALPHDPGKVEELSKTQDKGWNYTPWGKT